MLEATLGTAQEPIQEGTVQRPHPRDLEQVGVDGLLNGGDAGLLAEVVRAQQAEVVVRVAVVQRQDQVDQRLPAARAVEKQWRGSQGDSCRQEDASRQASLIAPHGMVTRDL